LSTAPAQGKWRALWNRRMLMCGFLGFTSGLPLFVLLNLVQAWLRTEGVTLKTISLFALIQFPYTWKFLWAPVMDRFAIPGLGRRRGWMALAALAVMGAIAALGQIDPRSQLATVVVVATLLAFFSASLDIVIDAFRRDILADSEQGLGTAIHVNAYKLAGLIPGSLALILADHLPWDVVFPITAAFMLPGLVMTLVVAEPILRGTAPVSLSDAVILPLREFLARGGWSQALWLLGFIFLYKLGDSLATSLSTVFYLDLGFSKTQIGLIAKNVGLWASVAGGLLGGAWLLTLGINRGLWLFGALQVLSILGFAVLAKVGAEPVALALAIGFEAFASVGLGTAAFTAFIARSTDRRYSATQFALFTSLASVPRTFANAGAGLVVEQTGWFSFFLICALLALPGLFLLPRVAPWQPR
jgi:PAT family beta-lactamase induction signal transducer AmpG